MIARLNSTATAGTTIKRAVTLVRLAVSITVMSNYSAAASGCVVAAMKLSRAPL
jgi:hypothetical protein